MHAEVHHALREERNGYPGCIGLLAASTSMEEYKVQKDAMRARFQGH